ncbi:MAG: glycosyl hydrolase [Actinomycetota bacterium]|nr:glycosyl hydrolase [Actinomycetota bacterium]
MLPKRICIALITLVLCGLAATAQPPPAHAAAGMFVGIYDPVQPLIEPDTTFPLLVRLRVQVIRIGLDWGAYVAKKGRPADPTDPADPAYNWDKYDQLVQNAAKDKIQVLFTIYGTPRWANGAKKSLNRAPRQMLFLKQFAYAAAKRYSGSFKAEDGTVLPAVRKWLAWNEPNNPVFLAPQWAKVGKGKYIPVAARTYAQICTAVWSGVHATYLPKEVVACGATAPRGNDSPRSRRPSISPLAFLAALKRYGLMHFDVYAHHPYYGRPAETPTTRPTAKNVVTLANIGDLTKLLSKLYGNKKLWITEYGYQTNPPDRLFGVSWANQARYLTQAYAIARKNPRITMMLWFLLRDEQRLSGWQSGLFTASGTKKPSYDAFRRLPH